MSGFAALKDVEKLMETSTLVNPIIENPAVDYLRKAVNG